MTEIVDYDDPNASHLTEEDKEKIKKLIKHFSRALPHLRMPIDPKIYPLVEVVIEMLHHQLEMELHFTYDDGIMEDSETSEEDVKRAVKEVKKERAARKKKVPKASLINNIPTSEELEELYNLEADEDEGASPK